MLTEMLFISNLWLSWLSSLSVSELCAKSNEFRCDRANASEKPYRLMTNTYKVAALWTKTYAGRQRNFPSLQPTCDSSGRQLKLSRYVDINFLFLLLACLLPLSTSLRRLVSESRDARPPHSVLPGPATDIPISGSHADLREDPDGQDYHP